MIHELGNRALNLACQEAASWDSEQTVSVNLSAVQFKNGDLVHTVALALADSGLPPQRLELEITESVLLGNSEENVRTLRALKDLGVSISLDDFGTGYSSLGYLRSFRSTGSRSTSRSCMTCATAARPCRSFAPLPSCPTA